MTKEKKCPESKNHLGLRSRELSSGRHMLVCAECGAEVGVALGVDGLRRKMKKLRIQSSE